MMDVKVLAIAPYEGLKEMILGLAEGQDMELRVETGDLQQGLKYAEEAASSGTDIIISRGGTAKLIQSRVAIPVVEIEVSGYDMLRVLTLAKGYPGKVAIVGFAQVVAGAAAVCEVLDMKISSYTVQDESGVGQVLQELREQGYQIIVGDVITVKEAEKLGLIGFLLTSGKESVLRSFQQARKWHALFEACKREYGMAYQVLQAEQAGVAVYDREQRQVFGNPYFNRQIAPFMDSEKIGRIVREILTEGTFHTMLEQAERIWRVSGYPLPGPDGPLAVLRIASGKSRDELRLRGASLVPAEAGFRAAQVAGNIVSHNSNMRHALDKAQSYRDQQLSVWISGEKGTGKELLAQFIHFGGERGLRPFLKIECGLASQDLWDMLLNEERNEELFGSLGRGTVFLRDIDGLGEAEQKGLADYLDKHTPAFQWIVSSREDILERTESGGFSAELYYRLAEVTLPLPSLRERKEDIEGLSLLYINEYNAKYGKQVAGLRDEAREALERFEWRGNIHQLRQVIEEAVLLAKGLYIEQGEISEVLSTRRMRTEYGKPDFDLSGTLEEIEQRIIQQVLMEEGMNQVKTAERLGISRTTLWRKIK
ncbi:sigma-54-dependent Fis family transcriptional regulator [Paenibacillus oralis]|uniref:Sigma-54-dependent Fis family transcriptional regulator n=1 Tax=Paenibacillus oralis TaxID=2490856 RepID=A0A3P3U4I3_9BACL|nr:sigma-54-dependent Fis family transcriptional regulator [Paenibacillus oralis]